MNKKNVTNIIILLILGWLTPTRLRAQTILSQDSMKLSEEAQIIETILEKNAQKITVLNDSISKLNDSIGRLNNVIINIRRSDSISNLKFSDISDSLRKEITLMTINYNKAKVKADSLNKRQEYIDLLSGIIFSQCLLYPLERAYNERYIKESLQCLTELHIWENPKYKDVCIVYKDLLEDYYHYNSEVMSFLMGWSDRIDTQVRKLGKEEWDVNAVTASAIKRELKQLSYYKFYERRNIEPYKSIVFLDDVVNDIEEMTDMPKSITRERFEELVRRMNPKNK